MSDSCYDLPGTPTALLREDLTRLRRWKGNMRVGDGPTARRFQDICRDIREIEAELTTRGEING